MNWRNVRLIFLREVRDQLRDRRTLFMIAVLPLVLYPSLGVGILQMTLLLRAEPRTVVVLGAEELPGPRLLEGDRFVSNWFSDPAQAERLRVVTEDALDEATPEDQPRIASLLRAAEEIRDAHGDYERLERERAAARLDGDEEEAGRLGARMEAVDRRRGELLNGSEIQVLILVPEGMREKLAEANDRIRERDAAAGSVDVPSPAILYNPADTKARLAYFSVKEVYDRWKDELLKERLRIANLPESFPTQVDATTVDLARDEERARSLWSQLFPALLVIMTLTGAFYPAVDVAAGEKERGTMETLLICPASRSEIVLGKYFTVMVFSVCTALLNLASMGLTGEYMASFALGGALPRVESLAPPPLASLAWVVVLLVPLSALFSALCLSLATFARSSKEGQYYLTPLLLVTVGLTVCSLSPLIEITPLYSMLPVMGISLLLKELLAGDGGYAYLAPVLLSSLGYAALALWWAVEQFSREDVLFREAERLELKLWLKHLMRDKDDTPSFAEAGLCFVVIMLLQFGSMRFFSEAIADGPPGEYGIRMVKLLMVQQLAIIATPALLMGVMLTRSMGRTFRLRLPAPKFLIVGALLPLALMPLSMALAQHLEWFFPPLPESIVQTLQLMKSDRVSIWLSLLAFAAAPALCEEIAFRGFILSGFLKGRRAWLAVGLSSLAFGAMHMIPQQVFNAALLGLVLGLLAVRSGSLWPGVLFHFIYNGSNVLLGRVAPAYAEAGFSWPVLAVCGLAAVVMIRWLITTGRPRRYDPPQPPTREDRNHAAAEPVGIASA